MEKAITRENLYEEIELIPEHKLSEIYDFVHYFRLSLQNFKENKDQIMKFAGCWKDMPEEMFNEFLEETAQRRKQAFSRRERDEASISYKSRSENMTDMKNEKLLKLYITRNENICGGKPIIRKTRIKVAQIAIEYDLMGLTADEIIQAHPHLTLAQVHDALSYYYDNVEEINSDIREGKQFVEEMKKQYPSILEKKRGRN